MGIRIRSQKILKLTTGIGASHGLHMQEQEELEDKERRESVRIEFVMVENGKTYYSCIGFPCQLLRADGAPKEGVRYVDAGGQIEIKSIPEGKYRVFVSQSMLLAREPAIHPKVEAPPKSLETKVIGPIGWKDLFKPIDGIETEIKNRIIVEREVVPIILVPAIMASRLKRKWNGKAKKIWDPDDTKFMRVNYLPLNDSYRSVNAATKQQRLLFNEKNKLDPGGLEPYPDDPVNNAEIAKKLAKKSKSRSPHLDQTGWQKLVEERGWGAVAWSFYGDLIKALEFDRNWAEPMTSLFRTPVYAFGYNWTNSNRVSGEKLRAEIKRIKEKENCSHVMLVTHSMGGIVARAACMLQGVPDQPASPLPPAVGDVLGVVHGVQPALGAAAAYWRMKAGFERHSIRDEPVAMVLGDNQAEVTGILGNIQGGLELLPNHLYSADGRQPGGWLEIHGLDGKVERLPKADPYEEIYLQKDKPYRLITERHLTPRVEKEEQEEYEKRWARSWKDYDKRIRQAKAFHAALGTACHPETHAFYGTGTKHRTAARIVFKLERLYGDEHKSDSEAAKELDAVGMEECISGAYTTYVESGHRLVRMVLQQPDGSGDGTVSEFSSSAVKPCGKSHSGTPSAPRAFPGIEHSEAYEGGAGEAEDGEDTIRFAMTAVEKLCLLKVKNRT